MRLVQWHLRSVDILNSFPVTLTLRMAATTFKLTADDALANDVVERNWVMDWVSSYHDSLTRVLLLAQLSNLAKIGQPYDIRVSRRALT